MDEGLELAKANDAALVLVSAAGGSIANAEQARTEIMLEDERSQERFSAGCHGYTMYQRGTQFPDPTMFADHESGPPNSNGSPRGKR